MGFFSKLLLIALQVALSFSTYHTTQEWCDAARGFSDMNPFCSEPEVHHKVCKKGVACKPWPNCRIIPFSLQEKSHMMNIHNEYRNNIALGKETRTPNGITAADMSTISWDVDLEFLALCHASDCEESNDYCRVVPPKNSVGQNYLISIGQKLTNIQINEAATKEWYEQITGVSDPNTYKEYAEDPAGNLIGQFTQMIWAATSRIGCAYTEKMNAPVAERPKIFVFCNYGQAGNVIGTPVFKEGKGASKCPPGKQANHKYTGLCGDVYDARGLSSVDDLKPSSFIVNLLITACCWLIIAPFA